jgi:hypothetical protein
VSFPFPPIIVSLPAPPLIILFPVFPVIILFKLFPIPFIFAVPVNVKSSTKFPKVYEIEEFTKSFPPLSKPLVAVVVS